MTTVSAQFSGVQILEHDGLIDISCQICVPCITPQEREVL